MVEMMSRVRRSWSALHAFGETQVVTKMKHVILVIVVGIISATGITAMFQRLDEANQRDIRRDLLISDWRNQLRDYDEAVDTYSACIIAVESRIATRDDNDRENQSDMKFIDIMDSWLDSGADQAIAEARAAELADAELDDAARPVLDPKKCEHPGEPPEFPTVAELSSESLVD